jgi:hypothetical protein
MTQYYLDEDWNLVKAPATASDLSAWANAFQQEYFPECVPNVLVAVNTNTNFGGTAAFEPNSMTIHISERVTPLENVAKICLLHEMVHVKLYTENKDADEAHGIRFKAEIKRLIEAGAYDNLV